MEDRQGRLFVGPAGRLLGTFSIAERIPREHFKFIQAGNAAYSKTPDTPGHRLQAEFNRLAPEKELVRRKLEYRKTANRVAR